ncbi:MULTISPECIES: hypothetical protein [unclassified Arthrobacter]|uniref:hypothetical protein n=1 Tax=unclassified Arthrobacter TaxID=235627 RepID=UPI0006DA9676|nr:MULTISPECIES: hypothetical protein [unclassified Arthrobacter]KPN21740.1 hypothetical protein AO716_01595 [Arthrobacter sp. Edens01]MSR97749.1 hypothetical protein [Arthrobacter sp. BL-252-APC-1A]
MVTHLLLEAYEDDEVASAFQSAMPTDDIFLSPVVPSKSIAAARAWFTELLRDESRLQPYKAPVYWAERTGASGTIAADKPYESFAEDFFELIDELQEAGYFPKVLKKDCVDDPIDLDDVRKTIRRATRLDIKWPMTPGDILSLSDDAVYSLVEYFHDQAQRPRTATLHSYGDCGLHFQNWNSQTGQSVYRWRLNALLENHGVPLRIGPTGEEQGRLIRHFGSPLDDLAESEVDRRAEEPEDEVAHAVRKYRARDASVVEKRSAIVMLYGEMEPKRKRIESTLSSSDASDLFRIANKFNLRHRGQSQQTEYGEEFLDWVFWTCLATLRLLVDLDTSGPPSGNRVE